ESLALWNGTTWSPIGPGLDPGAIVLSIAILPNGNLVIGGIFTIGGGPPSNLAQWNGSSWRPISGSDPIDPATGLRVMANGDLVAMTWSQASFEATIHRWNGANWRKLGLANGAILSVVELPDGDLVAGGEFTDIDGVAVTSLARLKSA